MSTRLVLFDDGRGAQMVDDVVYRYGHRHDTGEIGSVGELARAYLDAMWWEAEQVSIVLEDARWQLAVVSHRWVRRDPLRGFGFDERRFARHWKFGRFVATLRWRYRDSTPPGAELVPARPATIVRSA